MPHAAEFHLLIDHHTTGAWEAKADLAYRHLDAAQMTMLAHICRTYGATVQTEPEAEGHYRLHAAQSVVCPSSAALVVAERALVHLLEDLTLVPLALARP
jgi:hypothetical protein